MASHETVDVVIAGAGASGSTFAAVLAKAGKKVVLLDNGRSRMLDACVLEAKLLGMYDEDDDD